MQIVSNGDNFHEMSKPVFCEKEEKYHKFIVQAPQQRLLKFFYKFFWQIFQRNNEQKLVKFLSAFPGSMPLKPALTVYTAMSSTVHILFSSQLDHLQSQIAVLSVAHINNLHDSKLK